MKQTINFSQFCDAFEKMGRGNNFSQGGLRVLFDYLENHEEETGEEIELDVIALCCEYEERDIVSLNNRLRLFEDKVGDELSEEEKISKFVDYLNNFTSICGYTDNNTVVYASF